MVPDVCACLRGFRDGVITFPYTAYVGVAIVQGMVVSACIRRPARIRTLAAARAGNELRPAVAVQVPLADIGRTVAPFSEAWASETVAWFNRTSFMKMPWVSG